MLCLKLEEQRIAYIVVHVRRYLLEESFHVDLDVLDKNRFSHMIQYTWFDFIWNHYMAHCVASILCRLVGKELEVLDVD